MPDAATDSTADPLAAAAGGPRDRLRFLTCGSVDDGKSTLIGRLLYDAALVASDQLELLAEDSRRFGTTGGDLDFSLLLDGLEDERQQRITIDVAYRFFATARRAFIVADAPGHEQYTRNMATGASTADLAVILVDARKGLLDQTRRHSYIAALFGIRHAVLAVNKMDLVGWDEAIFAEIAEAYAGFARELGFAAVQAIPLAARHGDNVVHRSPAAPWYAGPSLLEHLETVEVVRDTTPAEGSGLRFPVQWVNRPNAEFRGYCGSLAAGAVAVGDPVRVAGTGQLCRIAGILGSAGPAGRALSGDAVTLTLDAELDIARGEMLVDPRDPPECADQFAAHLLWLGADRLLPGREYLLKLGPRTVAATVTALKHRVDIATLAPAAARTLAANEIGFVNLSTAAPLAFDAYERCRATGGFILIDRFTNETVAAGMIAFALRRAANIHWQAMTVSAGERARLKRQRPAVLWFTGLSGAGKSTIADLLEKRLFAAGHHTMLLDGDNLRHGLNRDLGFTDADRVENIRRVGEVAKLMSDAGLIVICSFISPFRAERQMARQLTRPAEFIEIFVDTPLAECIRRDPKGLYAKAQAGRLQNFTGIDSPYEAPTEPDLHLRPDDTAGPDILAAHIFDDLALRKII